MADDTIACEAMDWFLRNREGALDEAGRRLFLLGTAGFTIATIAVCLAPTLPSLDLARGLQGVAAAAALASGTAALAHAWQGPMRGRVFALLGATFGAGLALGPLLAGLLLQALGWRSVFAVGGVLTFAAFVLGARVLPESHGERGRLDVGGMLGFSLMLAALTLALLWLGEFGLHTVRVQLALLATLLLGAAFICIERLHRSPLLDLSLFSQPRHSTNSCRRGAMRRANPCCGIASTPLTASLEAPTTMRLRSGWRGKAGRRCRRDCAATARRSD